MAAHPAAVAAATAAAIAAVVAEGDGIIVNCICRTQYFVQRTQPHGPSVSGDCGTDGAGAQEPGGPRAACGGACGVVGDGGPTPGGVSGILLSRSTSDTGAEVNCAGLLGLGVSARTGVLSQFLASLESASDMNSAMDLAIEPCSLGKPLPFMDILFQLTKLLEQCQLRIGMKVKWCRNASVS